MFVESSESPAEEENPISLPDGYFVFPSHRRRKDSPDSLDIP